MDYFVDNLDTFMDLDSLWECLRALTFHQKYLNLCSEDERRSYEFGATWGWVIHDRNSFLGELSLELYPLSYPNVLLNNSFKILIDWENIYFITKAIEK